MTRDERTIIEIQQHERKYNCWVERIRYCTIRDTNIMWYIIGYKNIYDIYTINSNRKCEFSWPTIVLGMVKDRATQG